MQGECNEPGCDQEFTTVGMLTVGDTPLGPLWLCDEHAERHWGDE